MLNSKICLLAVFLGTGSQMFAQAAPAASAGRANLRYTFRYSQDAMFGGGLGNWQTVTPSGEVDYTNGSVDHEFGLDYAGGYTATIAGPSYSSGLFQRLFLSQGLVWKKWTFLASDDVSYRPQAPITGFSGIPGIGEPVGGTPSAGETIITVNTHVVNNSAHVSAQHPLTAATGFSVEGSSDLLRYPDGNGLDTDSQAAAGTFNLRVNARNSLWARYSYYQFSYPHYSLTFKTHSGMFGIDRLWTRRLSTSFSVGPEWITSSNTNVAPNSASIDADAGLNYAFRMGTLGLNYVRSTSGGAGYLLGARSDSVNGSFSRDFGREANLGVFAGYRRTSGLSNQLAINGQFAGAQISRRLSPHFSMFANYTVINQSSASTLASNVLNQVMHMASFGIAYSRESNRGH